MRSGLVVAALLLAASLLVPPSAFAQTTFVSTTLQVTVIDPGAALVASRPTTLEVRVRYGWGPGALASQPTEVLLAVEETPAWIKPTITPIALRFTVPTETFASGGAQELSAQANLTIDPRAPALRRENFTVRAEAKPNANLAGGSAVSPIVKLYPAYDGKIEIEPPEGPLVLPGGRESIVPFVVRSLSNGPSDVVFRLAEKPELSLADVPANLSLAPRGSEGSEQTVHVRLRLPWTSSQAGLLILEATPALGDALGTPARVEVEVEGRSVVPGPPAPLLGAGALAAALLLSRSRRQA